MSTSYTPEVSDYKLATVLAYDAQTKRVTVKLLPEFVNADPVLPDPESIFKGQYSSRFEMELDDEENSGNPIMSEDILTLDLSSMLCLKIHENFSNKI